LGRAARKKREGGEAAKKKGRLRGEKFKRPLGRRKKGRTGLDREPTLEKPGKIAPGKGDAQKGLQRCATGADGPLGGRSQEVPGGGELGKRGELEKKDK